jgi:hypothetical protein
MNFPSLPSFPGATLASQASNQASALASQASNQASALASQASNQANALASQASDLVSQAQSQVASLTGSIPSESDIADMASGQIDVAEQAVSGVASDYIESAISKNIPSAVKIIAADAIRVAKDVAIGSAVGAAIGTVIFPGIGTAVGGAIGTVAGAVVGAVDDIMGLFGSHGPPEFFDDAAWDKLSGSRNEGKETHAQGFVTETSNGISGTQLKLVRAIALIVRALGPGWKSVWPSLWNQIANKNAGILPNGQPTAFYAAIVKASGSPGGVNSRLLAHSVARFLGAPENGEVYLQGGSLAPFMPNAPHLQAAAKAASMINPKTGLPYPNGYVPGAAPAAAPTSSGWDLSGFNFGGIIGMGSLNPIGPIVIAPPLHAVVAAAAAGNPTATNTVLNAVSAARSPTASAAQTQLADTLALAHKIQTHAKYVQKWQGPAAGQAILNAHYLSLANLGA